MRDYERELKERCEFIREMVKESHTEGIVFGNSGGKDCSLVGILCKKACENTVSVMMPCGSKVNFGRDLADARAVCDAFGIENRMVDLTKVKEAHIAALGEAVRLSDTALTNIAPRLRMTTLYAIGASENRLVAGTGNRSEKYMGYFTKWGDGAHDFNPISDLTVTEVYEFLRFLGAPASVIEKAPSAGLFEGQTDEKEMGVTYSAIDRFLLTGEGEARDLAVIEKYHGRSLHKVRPIPTFRDWKDGK